MAYSVITFENPKTGEVRDAPVGFSWTVLLFGCFPAFFRKDIKWGIIMLLLMAATYGFSTALFMFIYNKLYIVDLIKDGFKAKLITDGHISTAANRMNIRIPLLNPPKRNRNLFNDEPEFHDYSI